MNKISNMELGILSTYILKAFIMINGINIILDINRQDSIISIILSFIIGILIIKVFNKSNYDLISNIEKSFSRLSSFIIKILLIICVIIFTSCLLYLSSMFIKASLLNNVDILPISILYILCISYLVSKGIITICRSGFISFVIFIILEITTLFFIAPNINSLRILPLLTQSFSKTILSSFVYIILSVLPIFLMCIIQKKDIVKNSKKKNTRFFYIITSIYILFNLILVLSIIDVKLCLLLDYPEISILSKISILDFFDRMESILSFKLLFDSFYTVSLSIYYINELIASIIGKKNKCILLILILILLFLSNYFTYNNILLIISLLSFGIINLIITIKFKK
ncbi:MAG: GerAB/ArcD/ProY family transporter [bacterium]|nr:GerAB/ArcD/ProY family transporter [bacterium]